MIASLWGRFQSLPRAARWGVVALLAFVAFFGVVEPALDATASANDRADRRETTLRWLSEEASRPDGEISRIRTGMDRFGKVDPPGDSRQRAEQLSDALARILTARGVREQTSTSRAVAINTGPLVPHVPQDQVLQRLVVDVQFDARPEVVARIVADLEAEACVAGVSRVTMRTSEEAGGRGSRSSRTVSAGLTVETWFVSPRQEVRR